MKLYLTHDDSAGTNYGQWFVDYLLQNVQGNAESNHKPHNDPATADAVLIVNRSDENYTQLRRHPLLQKCLGRCYVYDVHDRPLDLLPGLYASMPLWQYHPRRHRTAGYFAPINEEVQRIAASPPSPDLLCSFIGGPTSWVRKRLFQSNPFGDRVDVVIRNVYGWVLRGGETAEKAWKFREYAELSARSKFVICPRGIGTSSHRLFETMELGRVPVILSDQWVPPVGPNWNSFSYRLAERDWHRLPSLLAQWEPLAAEYGARARKVWTEWFSPSVQFERIADWIADLQKASPGSGRIGQFNAAWKVSKRRVGKTLRRLAKRVLRRS